MIETTNSIPGATLRVWVACLNVAAVCLRRLRARRRRALGRRGPTALLLLIGGFTRNE